MNKIRIATMLFTWNGVGDRFIKQYFEPSPLKSIIKNLTNTIIEGVELQCPNHVSNQNVNEVKEILDNNNIKPVIINVPLAGNIIYKKGSLTSENKKVREASIEQLKQAMDISKILGNKKISCFLGQDGFDYPLTTDYKKMRTYLVEGFREVAEYAPDVKIAIEYKAREPRSRQFLSSAARTICLANEIGLENIGLLVDIGHAWMAGENMGEVIDLTSSYNRLFHIHMNDNFLLADDDLGVGGVHLPEYIEALYWLKRVGYEDYVSLDVHSPREVSEDIILESAHMLKKIDGYINEETYDVIQRIVDSRDGTKLLKFIREIVFR